MVFVGTGWIGGKIQCGQHPAALEGAADWLLAAWPSEGQLIDYNHMTLTINQLQDISRVWFEQQYTLYQLN
jgi:hypothetical protein